MAMGICGRHTNVSPATLVGFQKVKLLKENLHWGLFCFPHLYLSNGKEEVVPAVVSAPSSDPWGTGTSCFHLGELRKE